MKRLLFIMHSMPLGGAERVLVDVLDNIDYKRYSITLLLQHNDGGLQTSINEKVNVRCIFHYSRYSKYHLLMTRILRSLHLLSLYFYIEKMRAKMLTDSNYDSIISFCQGPAHKIHMYLLNRSNNNITWVHSDLLKGNWGVSSFGGDIREQENAYNRMNTIVFVSNGARKSFNSLFNIKDDIKQPVICNIIDKEKIRVAAQKAVVNKPDNRFVFVNVGRLVEAKQQMRLLKAAEMIKTKRQDFIIWILGDGPLRSELESYILQNDLQNYVKLLGNQINPYGYVNSSDAFVLSSRQEGFPMVVCEALILSKPVICTNIVGPTEVLMDGKYGMIVEEDISSIAKGMLELMSNPDLREMYVKLAQERAKSFSVGDFMRDFDSIV